MIARRMRSRRSQLEPLLLLVTAALGVTSACGKNSTSRVAARVLERVANETAKPAWKPDSFFRRYAEK